jgi:hypothetical protein
MGVLFRDLGLFIAIVIAIAGIGGFLILRGALRYLVLIAALLIAAYVAGWLPRLP